MALRFLTIVFFLANVTAPFAKLEDTIIGNISGVSPTATEIANKKASNQSPFVNPLTNSTKGTITNMNRINNRLT